ncbi:MAG: magnesium transporter [Bdellovibrionota bacterium]
MSQENQNDTDVSSPEARDEALEQGIEELDPVSALFEAWTLLTPLERITRFKQLDRPEAEEFFLSIGARDQAQLIMLVDPQDRRSWIRQLAPDDAADVIQEIPPENRDEIAALLDKVTRREVAALLAYAEDEAGGLMSPRYARLRPDMSVDEAITYLRRQARRPIETISYFYVLDAAQVLLGVVSMRELFLEPGSKLISEIMQPDVISVQEDTNQEEVSRLLKQNNLIAIPVIDEEHHLKGIITVDDVMEAMEEAVTEDIQKIGGTEALDLPYLENSVGEMIRKRAGWLATLFIGEMFTASAMAYYENEISRAVVLALFIPLVISSGGNSGSQASTLVVRAMALNEVKGSHWFRVLKRELLVGISLGLILAAIGFFRIMLWPSRETVYTAHYMLVACTVSLSLLGVVLWGTLTGSMLPLLLRRLGLDPASASAPFVATLVDITGLVIYFSVASLMLRGVLL